MSWTSCYWVSVYLYLCTSATGRLFAYSTHKDNLSRDGGVEKKCWWNRGPPLLPMSCKTFSLNGKKKEAKKKMLTGKTLGLEGMTGAHNSHQLQLGRKILEHKTCLWGAHTLHLPFPCGFKNRTIDLLEYYCYEYTGPLLSNAIEAREAKRWQASSVLPRFLTCFANANQKTEVGGPWIHWSFFGDITVAFRSVAPGIHVTDKCKNYEIHRTVR